jgi:hypothetical protein
MAPHDYHPQVGIHRVQINLAKTVGGNYHPAEIICAFWKLNQQPCEGRAFLSRFGNPSAFQRKMTETCMAEGRNQENGESDNGTACGPQKGEE